METSITLRDVQNVTTTPSISNSLTVDIDLDLQGGFGQHVRGLLQHIFDIADVQNEDREHISALIMNRDGGPLGEHLPSKKGNL